MISLLAPGLIAVCVWIGWRIALVLHQGAARARLAKERRVYEWREMGDFGNAASLWSEHLLPFLREWAARFRLLRGIQGVLVPPGKETFFDPVDGTSFGAGETVIRCSCGAAYHTHSWQWLGEKNGAKCVSCKKAGRAATVAS